jgi:hypothetical protein
VVNFECPRCGHCCPDVSLIDEGKKAEPVAWMDRDGDVYKELPTPYWNPPHTPLYAAPQPRREPLTDEELRQLWRDSPFRGNGGQIDWFMEGARAVIAAYRAKQGETK